MSRRALLRRARLGFALVPVMVVALLFAVPNGASRAHARPAARPIAVRAQAPSSLGSIRHVFIIVLENESASTTFGTGSLAPYLSQTMRGEGAYLPNYHGIGHESNDNYIAMISGQAPNPQNQADCQYFDDVEPGTIGAYGQAIGTGCVFGAGVPTIASQLTQQGFTWRDYNEDMGADSSRESSVCGHPAVGSQDRTQTATATDMYATRHNPFVYFHSIIDNTALCDGDVVNLDDLPQDLASAAATPNYVFITPDLCDDGHDSPCANGQPGGLVSANAFLENWVPQITASPAFRQNGLLIVTFDESADSDTSDCCGEMPGPNSPEPGIDGPGGGDVGAVLLSPCIAPGTVSETPYNHYTMLGSIENIFGLPHIGYAGLPGETYFGADIFNRSCGAGVTAGSGPPPPGVASVTVDAPALLSTVTTRARETVRWSSVAGARYVVESRDLSTGSGAWKVLADPTSATSMQVAGSLGHTYEFRVAAVAGGATGAFGAAFTVIPTGIRPAGGHYSRHWRAIRRRGAWQQRAIVSTTRGASFSLRYVGSTLALVGERTARGGVLRVTFDGHSRTVRLHAGRLHRRQALLVLPASIGVHHLRLTVVRGLVALEGYGIAVRTG